MYYEDATASLSSVTDTQSPPQRFMKLFYETIDKCVQELRDRFNERTYNVIKAARNLSKKETRNV